MLAKQIMETTTDAVLDGRVVITQPKKGFRVSMDPVFLAAAIPAQSGEKILDVGTGVGAAMLCLAHRVEGCKVIGLERDLATVRLASENIKQNNFSGKAEVVRGDLLQPPPRLAASTFHHVIANPPYLETAGYTVPTDPSKRFSNFESEADLRKWIAFCALMAQPKGTLTFIHRTERLNELVTLLSEKAGDVTVFPLWSKDGQPSKRVIVQARKNTNGPFQLKQGIILHTKENQFTSEANDILRNGKGLDL